MRALELFAGIGGLGLAAPSGWQVVAAVEQDAAAASTHRRNFGVPVVPRDIAGLAAPDLLALEADAWLASPPCQPFTRRGRGRDVDDPRCRGLLRLVELLPECRPRRVLVENVVGFAGSRAHALLVDVLAALGHDIETVSCCPSRHGWPVRRPREFVVSSADGLRAAPPSPGMAPHRALGSFLDAEPDEALRVAEAVEARWGDALPSAGSDGVLPTFTRSYGRAVTGAGPVHWDAAGARYFAGDEILRLHDFPESFAFPPELDLRTRWRLAGNTVHVGCVREVAARLA